MRRGWIAALLTVTLVGISSPASAIISSTTRCNSGWSQSVDPSPYPYDQDLVVCVSQSPGVPTTVINDTTSVWYFSDNGAGLDLSSVTPTPGWNDRNADFNFIFREFAGAAAEAFLTRERTWLPFILPGESRDVPPGVILAPNAALSVGWLAQQDVLKWMGSQARAAIKTVFTAGSPLRKALWGCTETAVKIVIQWRDAQRPGSVPGLEQLYNSAVEADSCLSQWEDATDRSSSQTIVLREDPPKPTSASLYRSGRSKLAPTVVTATKWFTRTINACIKIRIAVCL